MSTDFRTVLEHWRDLADADLLCPQNPAETDWGAVVAAIAATRAALAQPEVKGPSLAEVDELCAKVGAAPPPWPNQRVKGRVLPRLTKKNYCGSTAMHAVITATMARSTSTGSAMQSAAQRWRAWAPFSPAGGALPP